MELGILEQNEEHEKKHKNISLKAEPKSSKHGDNSNEDENITLLFKKFGKLLKKDKKMAFGKSNKFSKRKERSNSNQNFTCFKYGRQGHIKVNCPSL